MRLLYRDSVAPPKETKTDKSKNNSLAPDKEAIMKKLTERKQNYEPAMLKIANTYANLPCSLWNTSKTGMCVHVFDEDVQVTNLRAGDQVDIVVYGEYIHAEIVWASHKNLGVKVTDAPK